MGLGYGEGPEKQVVGLENGKHQKRVILFWIGKVQEKRMWNL